MSTANADKSAPAFPQAPTDPALAAVRPTPTQWFALVFGYFVFQMILRTCLSGSADLDESDQLVLTQRLLWGYGPQPPLYTWLQIGFFKVFGCSIFSLALLKDLLLFGTYTFTYLNARTITGRHDCGIAAAASLLFIPQIAWESQRDLTHSVLASTLTTATLFLFLRARASRRTSAYIAFGLCAGLGMLSKLNYAAFFCGLMVAAVSLSEFRSAILNSRMALAIALVVALTLPTSLWLLNHRDLALLSVSKFHIKETVTWSASVFDGLKSAGRSVVSFLGPLLLIYFVLFWTKRDRGRLRRDSEYARLLLRALAVMAAMIVLGIFLFKLRDLRDRWFQPVLITTPVLMITLFQQHLDRQRLKGLLIIAAASAAAVSILIPGKVLLAERMRRTEPLNRPYDQLAQELAASNTQISTIVTDTRLLGGNLRLQLPGKTCLPPELAPLFMQPDDSFVLAWDATQNARVPKTLAEFALSRGFNDVTNQTPQFFSATFKYHLHRRMRIGVIAPTR